jgi:hypothetical protein
MWLSLAQLILQVLRDPALTGIVSLLSILAFLIAAIKWAMNLQCDLKNLLCFYNETSVLKVKQTI